MSERTFDRRDFLRRAGLATAGATAMTLGAPRPAARADESLAPFPWGVASGDPMADRVVLWTRIDPSVGASVDVGWVLASDPDLTQVVASSTFTTNADRDHTVKLDPTGLSPATWYWFQFTAPDGRRSLVGRTKTAPSAGAERLRFGMVSCTNYEGGFFNAYARLAERNDLDAILHLGDYLYEYEVGHYGPGPEIGRTHEPPVEQVTLEQYRGRQAHYKLDPDLRRLHQLYPWITTWDDHETTNDSWSGGAENHQDDEGDWEERKRTALRAYDEWMPIRMDAPPDQLQLYRGLSYGDLVDIIVLDTRIDGRDGPVGGVLSQDPTAPFQPDLASEDRNMISEAQRTWLLDRLSNSTAQWKLLAQQVMMMQWKAGALPSGITGAPDFPSLVLTPGGTPVNGDAWDGFPAERARILSHIRDNGIDDVVVLTGDIHSSWAADVTIDPYDGSYNPLTGDGSICTEFVCPSVTSDSFYKTLGFPYRTGSIALEEGTKADNPHIKFVQGDDHGYVLLDITAERCQAQFWSTHDVLEPNTNHELMATWETLAGANRVTSGTAASDPEDGPSQPSAEPADEPAEPAPAPQPAPLPVTGGGALVAGVAAIGAAGVISRRRRGGPTDSQPSVSRQWAGK